MFLVLGTGRSGTSTVARLLHEHGVCMGIRFREADEQSPNGYFEDRDFVDVNQQRLEESIGYPQFLTEVGKQFMVRDVVSGLKDPRLCHFLNEYQLLHQHEFGEYPQLIRCIRPKERVVASMVRCYGWSESQASELHDTRVRLLDAKAKYADMLVIDFTKLKTDTQIYDEQLKGFLS